MHRLIKLIAISFFLLCCIASIFSTTRVQHIILKSVVGIEDVSFFMTAKSKSAKIRNISESKIAISSSSNDDISARIFITQNPTNYKGSIKIDVDFYSFENGKPYTGKTTIGAHINNVPGIIGSGCLKNNGVAFNLLYEGMVFYGNCEVAYIDAVFKPNSAIEQAIYTHYVLMTYSAN